MSDIKEELGGLKESIEFNEIWWSDVQEGEPICQDEIDLVLEMIVMAKAELDKNAFLLTTLESQQKEIAQLKDELKCRYGDYFSAKQKQVDSLLRMLEGNSETMQLQISEIEQKDSQIESLKAITELAVKGLKKVVNENTGFPRMVARETLSEIERLQNEKP